MLTSVYVCQTEVISIYTIADKGTVASVYGHFIICNKYTMKSHSGEVKGRTIFVLPAPEFQSKYLSQCRTKKSILAFTNTEIV